MNTIVADTRTSSMSLRVIADVFYSYVSTCCVGLLAVLFYSKFSPTFTKLYSASWRPRIGDWVSPITFTSGWLFQHAFLAYVLVLVPYYVIRRGKASKASIASTYLWHCLRARKWFRLAEHEKQAFLTLAVKFVFIPFCLNALIADCANLNNYLLDISDEFIPGGSVDLLQLYLSKIHFVLLYVIFLIDLAPFLVGYMVESKWLKNEIVSVESSAFGWLVCLACYAPFNTVTGSFLSWSSSDYVIPSIWLSDSMRVVLNLAIVVLFGGFAWASVAIGFKCSNLTNRGTVDMGPYRFVRHPAYVCKNVAWWVAGIPVLADAFNRSVSSGVWLLICICGVGGIYAMRAITEERHMLRCDTGYRDYMQRVRWRFIPGVA